MSGKSELEQKLAKRRIGEQVFERAPSASSADASASEGAAAAGVAYRRKEEDAKFHAISKKRWWEARSSERQWIYHTGKAVVTLLRCDKFSEVIPYGLMDSGGWVSVRDIAASPSIDAWGLQLEEIRNLARHQGEKKRFELDERADKMRACQGHSLVLD